MNLVQKSCISWFVHLKKIESDLVKFIMSNPCESSPLLKLFSSSHSTGILRPLVVVVAFILPQHIILTCMILFYVRPVFVVHKSYLLKMYWFNKLICNITIDCWESSCTHNLLISKFQTSSRIYQLFSYGHSFLCSMQKVCHGGPK